MRKMSVSLDSRRSRLIFALKATRCGTGVLRCSRASEALSALAVRRAVLCFWFVGKSNPSRPLI